MVELLVVRTQSKPCSGKCVLGQSVPPESDSTQTTADRVSVDEEKIQ